MFPGSLSYRTQDGDFLRRQFVRQTRQKIGIRLSNVRYGFSQVLP
jgi:hypothetical protein